VFGNTQQGFQGQFSNDSLFDTVVGSNFHNSLNHPKLMVFSVCIISLTFGHFLARFDWHFDEFPANYVLFKWCMLHEN